MGLTRKTQPERTDADGPMSITAHDDGSLTIMTTHNGEESSLTIHPYNAWWLASTLCFMLGMGTTTKEIASSLMKVKL
jgi:hypothetical protein